MTLPPVVRRAEEIAAAAGLAGSCRPEDGQLLHVLAARRGLVRVGEIGPGFGVSSAWIVSALAPEVPFVTVELDSARAEAVRGLFAEDANVTVLEGDWRAAMPPEAPFDLLFVGAADAKGDPDAVIGLLTPGGTVVVTVSRSTPDPRRDAWLARPSLAAVVVATGGGAHVLVATRVR